jgi:putative acetyltransferase
MGTVYRRAMRKDASRLHDIRRQSILGLASPTMTVAEAQAWAAKLTPSGMEMKLRELEIWVAERAGIVAGGGPFVATSWRDCTRRQNSPGRG